MSDTRSAVWDPHVAQIDARMVELGMADSSEIAPGSGFYYGDIMAPEHYEAYAVRDLGLMPDGSFRAPAVGRAAARLEDACVERMAARDQRDFFGDRSLVALDRVCHANVAVHRGEQALAEAEQREAAGELDVDGDARLRLADDEQLLHHSIAMQNQAEREAEPEPGN